MSQPNNEVDPRTPTALIGDPDPALRQSVASLLTRAGQCVLGQAEEPAELLALARKLGPKVIVLGLSSAEQSDLDPVRELRSGSSPAIVLLAPIASVTWVRAARAAGVDALLGRPPRECDLLAAVETSLSRRVEVARLQRDNELLQQRIDTFALVARARELLVRRDGIGDEEAQRRLLRQAERTGRTLRSVAEAVLLAETVAPSA